MFVGTIASIVSLIIGLWKYRRVYLIINTLLVVALSVFSSYSYFSYKAEFDAQKQLTRKREEIRKEAAVLFKSFPGSSTYYNPGESRGIALASIAFLEQHQDVYPDTYQLVRSTFLKDLESAQSNRDTSVERQSMETAANSLKQIIWSLSGPQDTR